MIACFFVFTSKQNRRSSAGAGRTLQSKTPICSLSSTPPARVPCISQPKIPDRTKAQRRTQFVRVGFPVYVLRYSQPCFSAFCGELPFRNFARLAPLVAGPGRPEYGAVEIA